MHVNFNINCIANFSPKLTHFSLFSLSHYFQNKYSTKIEQGVPDSKQILKKQIQYKYYPVEAPGYSFCGKGKYKSLLHCVQEKAVKCTEATSSPENWIHWNSGKSWIFTLMEGGKKLKTEFNWGARDHF